jgi:CRISPR/Cas system type I-B associated protein Csh2 (Cas7 group RAMP superfamily)
MDANQAFKKRIYGCAIIKAVNSNYNADFTHQPRKLPDGIAYGTDKALKYLVKNYLKKERGEKIFVFRNMDENLKPLTLDKTYLLHFNAFPTKSPNTGESFIFKKEGNNFNGFISKKPTAKQVENYFKELKEEEDNLKPLEKVFKALAADKKAKPAKLEEAQRLWREKQGMFQDEDNCWLYLESGKDFKKLEGDFEAIEIVSNGIEKILSGGIDKVAMLKNLLSCLDIRLFGQTYAGETNISIHGPVQINHGVNRFPESITFSEQILAPYANPSETQSGQDRDATTLGSQSKLREGHYVHHFSVNPKNLETHVNDAGEGANNLTEQDINLLKEGLRKGATYYESAAKTGTENEVLLWVELREGCKVVLPNFTCLIDVPKKENCEKTEINFTRLAALLERESIKSCIEKIEVFHNPELSDLIGLPDSTEYFDLEGAAIKKAQPGNSQNEKS